MDGAKITSCNRKMLSESLVATRVDLYGLRLLRRVQGLASGAHVLLPDVLRSLRLGAVLLRAVQTGLVRLEFDTQCGIDALFLLQAKRHGVGAT